ncbi:MAG: SRPBCC family protein [Flavitalea sp.]
MEYNQEGGSTVGHFVENLDSDDQVSGIVPNVSNFERGLSIGIGALLIYSSVKNFKKTPLRAMIRAGLGTGLIMRGSSGSCPAYSTMEVDGTKTEAVNIRTTLVVNKPRHEVYAAWRNLGTLPRFMKHLANVTQLTNTRSHWEAKIPQGSPVSISWDADIVKDEPNELLSWRSLPGSTIENAGKVEFRDALGHHGTEIRVIISYRPPAGNIGGGVAKLLNPLFRKLLHQDIQGFKEYIELHNENAPGGFR